MHDFSGKTVVITGGSRGIGHALVMAFLQAGATVVPLSTKDGDLSITEERDGLLFDRVDILVNCAGISIIKPALDLTVAEFEKILTVNLTAVFDLSCRAVRLGCKRIINIGSVSGRNGSRNISAYCASKHALVGLTKCLADEWGPRGVTVNCVSPGFIQTDMLKIDEKNIGRIPLGRVGLPEEVAPMVLLLASDEASYMTGGDYLVDGGWVAR
jgi:NAD(P)-dependent dehydrogenase (short-subunit alcohol dehydrogenase family)